MYDFDPKCDFLLAGNRASLFEPADARDETTFRCKGCRSIVLASERLRHGEKHVRELERREQRRREQLRALRLEAMARAREARRRAA